MDLDTPPLPQLTMEWFVEAKEYRKAMDEQRYDDAEAIFEEIKEINRRTQAAADLRAAQAAAQANDQ